MFSGLLTISYSCSESLSPLLSAAAEEDVVFTSNSYENNIVFGVSDIWVFGKILTIINFSIVLLRALPSTTLPSLFIANKRIKDSDIKQYHLIRQHSTSGR
jgi:hypothetical protein